MVNATPKILVSIKPIHSIVSYITSGVTEPELLLSNNGSPHTFTVRPSDVDKLQQAEVIIWVGDGLESFLTKALHNLDKNKVNIIKLIDIQGLEKLPLRTSKDWEACEHSHQHHDHAHHTDMHIWLSIHNMQQIAVTIKNILVSLDPSNSQVYEKNTTRLLQELDALHQKLANKFAQIEHKPFLVFHDAFQYLEKTYHLNGVGAVMLNPGQEPSAKRIVELNHLIHNKQIQCVCFEPQFNHNILNPILEGTKARTTMLDHLGATLPQNSQLYFKMMDELSDNLITCLSEQ